MDVGVGGGGSATEAENEAPGECEPNEADKIKEPIMHYSAAGLSIRGGLTALVSAQPGQPSAGQRLTLFPLLHLLCLVHSSVSSSSSASL